MILFMKPHPSYYRNSRSEILNFLPKASLYSRVLEVGCGEGTFSSQFLPSCEVWGIEINPEAADKASAVLSKVFCGSFFSVVDRIPDNYFDLIIANDVIEHLENHDEFFRIIAKKLVQNGWIVGSVPNVRYWSSLVMILIDKDWKYQKTGIHDSTHLRFFTYKSLRRSITMNGFVVERLSASNRMRFHSWGIKSLGRYIFAHCAVLLTLGYFRDVLIHQYGFRASKNHGV
jgi:2-polyprenyl-3-methyl-5-hydroxy-6-metoxy-1,4-benzoquinol methylase